LTYFDALLALVGLRVFVNLVVTDLTPFLRLLCFETIRHIVATCMAKQKGKSKNEKKSHQKSQKKVEINESSDKIENLLALDCIQIEKTLLRVKTALVECAACKLALT